jgi:hypothetical protein
MYKFSKHHLFQETIVTYQKKKKHHLFQETIVLLHNKQNKLINKLIQTHMRATEIPSKDSGQMCSFAIYFLF